MRCLLFSLFIINSLILSSQTEKVKFKFILEKEPLIGATLFVKGSNPENKTYTDLNGNAELNIRGQETIQISFLGPYTELKLERQVDSVYVNLNKKKAVFYYKGKKQKQKKVKMFSP